MPTHVEDPNGKSSSPVTRQDARRQKTIHSCNFRSAGRLSNEDARLLTAIHEGFAQLVSTMLDAYVGTSCEVKLEGLEQLSIKEHVVELPAHCYIVPLSPHSIALEFENDLVFPIIELLLGGPGDTRDAGRDLSEIEEEIMEDIVQLIGRQAASAWRMPDLTFAISPRIKPIEMQQALMAEKVTVFRFSVQLAGVSGAFRVVVSSEFLNAVLKQINQEKHRKKSRVRSFPMPPLRERILDCDVEVTAELPMLRVQVRDLIALQPGSVLKLHAPIRNPSMLTSGGHRLFEAAPVRIGSQRAAQLGRSIRSTDQDGR
jgi:flagellar motor switch protein FliM